MKLKSIVILLGPTGVGKTKVALELAKRLDAEIVNADSRQIYRELNIGTSKPTPAELTSIPHHLFNLCHLTDSWDAQKFVTQADQTIENILKINHLPLITGGTAFYIKALLFGLFEGPTRDEEVRVQLEKQMEEQGSAHLHAELLKKDPAAAQKIQPTDTHRLIRALEVHTLTGKPMSQWQEEHAFSQPRYRYLKLGLNLPRAELYLRINQRVDQMVVEGLEEEVRPLALKKENLPLLEATIGYAEWLPFLRGEISKDEVIQKIKQNTRHLAKRQLTWFRKEKDIEWLEVGEVDKMVKLISDFLKL